MKFMLRHCLIPVNKERLRRCYLHGVEKVYFPLLFYLVLLTAA